MSRQSWRPSARSLALAAAAALALATGSALAIVALDANIRGDAYSSTNPPAGGAINGKAAGLNISFSDDNVVVDQNGSTHRGTSTTTIESNGDLASIKHVLTQRTDNGPLRLTILAESAHKSGDPAVGVEQARMLLKWVRWIADEIFVKGAVPEKLPEGVTVQLDRPDRVGGKVVLNTLRVLLERHFILGFAALSTRYVHTVTRGDVELPARGSTVSFGPGSLQGLETRVNETVTN